MDAIEVSQDDPINVRGIFGEVFDSELAYGLKLQLRRYGQDRNPLLGSEGFALRVVTTYVCEDG